jgi:hypothetical protein
MFDLMANTPRSFAESTGGQPRRSHGERAEHRGIAVGGRNHSHREKRAFEGGNQPGHLRVLNAAVFWGRFLRATPSGGRAPAKAAAGLSIGLPDCASDRLTKAAMSRVRQKFAFWRRHLPRTVFDTTPIVKLAIRTPHASD